MLRRTTVSLYSSTLKRYLGTHQGTAEPTDAFNMRTGSAPKTTRERTLAYSPLFANPDTKQIVDSIVRVDQAGEFGAAKIYEGQLAVLRGTSSEAVIQHTADQEKEHQKTFDQLLRHYRVRPTLLTPIWDVAGYALGAGSALLGKETAMAITEAVETVISDHYNDQLRKLHQEGLVEGDYLQLRTVIKKFRDEEVEHHDIAIDHDAQKAPLHPAVTTFVKGATKLAILLSQKV